MDATVITPTAGQAVITTERDEHRPHRHDFAKFNAAEQAAYGRLAAEQHADIRHDIGEAKFDLAAALDQRHVAAADRLADVSRDILTRVAHVNDATREGQAKLQQALSDIRYEQIHSDKELTERLGHIESRMLLEMQRHSTENERRIADARVESLKEHCEIKELIRCEAAKTREQSTSYRMSDLERDNLKLSMKLDFLAKP